MLIASRLNHQKERTMSINPYLFYDGRCEEAFKFYEKVLGGKIEAMLTFDSAPETMPVSSEWKKKIMHAMMKVDGQTLMGSDPSPGHYQKPQGFAVSLQLDDSSEAERKFNALAAGGTVNMPFGKTFWSKGFGMCVDQFGIAWMVNVPA
jgi:PhnB protein